MGTMIPKPKMTMQGLEREAPYASPVSLRPLMDMSEASFRILVFSGPGDISEAAISIFTERLKKASSFGRADVADLNPDLMSGQALTSASWTMAENAFPMFSGPLEATSLTAESRDPPDSMTTDIIPTAAGTSLIRGL